MRKNIPPIIIWTQSFNGEKTLARSIESVLSQTYTDFTYYCLDHASEDSTSEIISTYAEKDHRIVPLHEDINLKGIRLKYFQEFLKKHGEETLVVTLDDDDTYSPDFLEKMIEFLLSNDLDIAFCHSRKVEIHGGYLKVELPETIAVDIGEFVEKYFYDYYMSTTTFWKNISRLRNMIECIENMQTNCNIQLNVAYSGGHMIDNLCMLEHLKLVSRIGCLSEFLHTQYMGNEQLSRDYNADWYRNVIQIKESMTEFLESFGPISEINRDIVRIRYVTLLKYILARLFASKCSFRTRLRDVLSILEDKSLIELLNTDFISAKIRTEKSVFLDWIKFASSDYRLDEDCKSDEDYQSEDYQLDVDRLKAELVSKIEELKQSVL